MTKQDARLLAAGDQITDGRKVFSVVEVDSGYRPEKGPYVKARRPHAKTVLLVHPTLNQFQRAKGSTRKGRRAAL